MSDSTSNLDLISVSQSQKEVTANALFDAASPAMLYGRRAVTTAGLTWGYYGGALMVAGAPVSIPNGTVALAASTTNYVEADATTGAVSANASAFTAGRIPLYQIVTGAASVTSYGDKRAFFGGIGAGVTDGDKGDITVTDDGDTFTIDPDVLTAYGRTLIDDVNAAAARTTLGLGTAATLAADTDNTLAANSDAAVPTQKAVKEYIDSIVSGGASDVMVFKGVIDCSTNPNYPAASAGYLYKVSVAGKIGGASGPNVEAGDTLYCITDGTAAGNHATVGAAWNITQVNVDGAVIGPAAATDSALALYNGTTGKLIKDSAVTLSTDGTFTANSDALVPTEKAIKTYVATAVSGVAGTPGGSTTQIQFNNAGVFAGDDSLTWDSTNNILYVGPSNGTGTIKGTTGATSSAAGATVLIQGGTGGASTGNGGKVTIQGGTPGTTGGTTGVEIFGAPSGTTNGGPVVIQGGTRSGGTAGAVTVSGGTGSTGATGGPLVANGGDGVAGGTATFRAGDASGNGSPGGAVTLRGGHSLRSTIGGTVPGGAVSILGGNATGTTNSGAGGAVTVKGGTGGVSNANGGNIILAGGAGGGTGAKGSVVFDDAGAALATGTTGGFACFASCAGTPTGTPAGIPAGAVPCIIDTTNSKLYLYIGGAWKSVTLT